MDHQADVCVVGSGAAGSVVAERLSRVGFKVVVFEIGRPTNVETVYDDVLLEAEPAYARLDNGSWALVGYPWSTCNVGGGTVFYGGASFRLRRIDFTADEIVVNAELPCSWPIGYDDLAPHYDLIEKRLGVAGECSSNDPTHPGGNDPLLPPVPLSPQARRVAAAARSRGLSPFATPMAIATRPYGGRPQCTFCSPCIEHRCKSGAKADAFSVFLKRGVNDGSIQLKSGFKVARLVEGSGRVKELLAYDVVTGHAESWRARYFVLAANAIQSAALLLRSGDRLLPNGIGNEHNMVGRGLCLKLNGYVAGYGGLAEELDADDPWRGTVGPYSTLSITDYYSDPECPTGMGGLMYEARYGVRYGVSPREDAARLECLIADRPSFSNCVRLAPSTGEDGLRRIIIDYRPHPFDLARLQWMSRRADDLLAAAGFSERWPEAGGYGLGSSHMHGTCRAGRDPKTSVVDPEGRVHSTDNLYVADGGYMPFPGGVNPTLTIQAVASLVADAIAARLGRPDAYKIAFGS